MFEVRFPTRSPKVLIPVIGEDRVRELERIGELTREKLSGRRVVSINSTASGGGVAEMLPVLLAYVSGVGVDGRWLVVEGSPAFFEITKRLHNHLHGSPGDGGPLGPEERAVFDEVGRENESHLRRLLEPGDTVLLHDPQPAPLAAWLSSRNVPLAWRCHIGIDDRNEYTEKGWEFLRPMLEPYADSYVFTRREYAPDWVPADRLHVIRPSLDPFAPKNVDLDPSTVLSVLQFVGILSGGDGGAPEFHRSDGSSARMSNGADIVRRGAAPAPDVPMVVQISRWDELKDMAGVMRAFLDDPGTRDACLVLAGPDVSSVSDDPEGQKVLADVIALWKAQPDHDQERVQIVCLPMDDPEENATMVNALQRHASVVVQKSLQEGFGLTVAEAMLKARPVVASAVGGIVDQIDDGISGSLVWNPRDTREAGAAIVALLADPVRAERIGQAARETVIDKFLPDTSLSEWAKVLDDAISGARARELG